MSLVRKRKSNRRILLPRQVFFAALDDAFASLRASLAKLGKVLLLAAAFAAAVLAVRWGVAHVLSSPRFAVHEIRVSPMAHATQGEIVALAGVGVGDRLITLRTAAVAERVAGHPWVAAVRVRRQLPGVLVIDVTERQAVATAMLGVLYLVDEEGRPFKRASLDEADGLPVVTGLRRESYEAIPALGDVVLRDAVSLGLTYARVPGRPALSEIHVDSAGPSLFLAEGGAEIRLGKGAFEEKLARLDAILASLGPGGAAALRVVHLEGGTGDRVPVRLALENSRFF